MKTETRKPIMHELKSWIGLFEPLYNKTKTHDLRPMDRDYQVGDYILWREWNVREKSYTGRECRGKITYITSDQHSPCAFSPVALHPDSAILSVEHINSEDMLDVELV